MTVDRGGLRYTIEVVDEFSGKLESFRRLLREGRHEFGTFRRSVTGLASETKALAGATIRLEQAQATSARTSRRRASALTIEEKAAEKLRKAEEELAIVRVKDTGAQLALLQAGRRRVQQLTQEAEVEKRVARILREKAVQQKLSQRLEELGVQTGRQKARVLTDQEEAAKRLARQERELRLAQLQDPNKIAQLNAELAARKALVRQLTEQALAQRGLVKVPQTFEQKAQAQFARDLDAAKLRQRVEALKAASAEFQNLTNKAKGANDRIKEFLFTFRRLVGVLALFTIARKTAEGISAFISATISSSADLEQASLGVATLVTALGQVRDRNGEVVSGVSALDSAVEIADTQLKQLRVDAIKTSASFGELAEAFQIAIGASGGSGLDIDELRQITVLFSQAATAIGLEQSRLSEEIRSILTGTATSINTRLARVFGLPIDQLNEQIKVARESGTLFEFLTTRLEAFGIASDRAMGTFNNRLQRFQETIILIAQTGAADLFQDLSNSLGNAADAAGTVQDGQFVVSPQAARLAKAIADGLRTAVVEAKKLGQATDLDTLIGLAQTFGATLSASLVAAGAALRGVFQGLRDINTVVQALRQGIDLTFRNDVFGGRRNLEQIIVLVTRILTLYTAWRLIAIGVALVHSSLPIAIGVAVAALVVLNEELVRLKTALVGVERLDFDLTLKSFAVELGAGLAQLFPVLSSELIRLGNLVLETLEESLVKAGDAISKAFFASIKTAFEGLRSVPGVQRFLGSDIDATIADLDARLAEIDAAQERFLERNQERIEQFNRDNRAGLRSLLEDIDEQRASLQDEIRRGQSGRDQAGSVEEITSGAPTVLERLTAIGREAGALGDILRAQALDDPVASMAEEADRASVAFRNLGNETSSALDTAKAFAEAVERRLRTRGLFDRLQEDLNRQAGEDQLRLEQKLGEERRRQADKATKRAEDRKRAEQEALERSLEGNLPGGQDGDFFREGQERLEAAQQAVVEAGFGIGQALRDVTFQRLEEEGKVVKSLGDYSKALSETVKEQFKGSNAIRGVVTVLTALQNPLGFLIGFLGGASSPGQGFHSGGSVRRGGKPSLAHVRASGLASGGRPPGLHPADTVPAWLQPGEFVMRLSAVRQYGAGVMEALNRASVDPGALSALAGAARPGPVSARAGYASGGTVAAPPVVASSGPAGPSTAFVVADQQALERMLAGGSRALMGFLRDNSAAVNSALGRSR